MEDGYNDFIDAADRVCLECWMDDGGEYCPNCPVRKMCKELSTDR